MKITSIDDIPKRATIVEEFTRCGNPHCAKKHGPYKYAYWKENGRLNKVYIGKSFDDLKLRLLCEKTSKEIARPASDVRKIIRLVGYVQRGNPLAKEYFEKIGRKELSPNWAVRKFTSQMSPGLSSQDSARNKKDM